MPDSLFSWCLVLIGVGVLIGIIVKIYGYITESYSIGEGIKDSTPGERALEVVGIIWFGASAITIHLISGWGFWLSVLGGVGSVVILSVIFDKVEAIKFGPLWSQANRILYEAIKLGVASGMSKEWLDMKREETDLFPEDNLTRGQRLERFSRNDLANSHNLFLRSSAFEDEEITKARQLMSMSLAGAMTEEIRQKYRYLVAVKKRAFGRNCSDSSHQREVVNSHNHVSGGRIRVRSRLWCPVCLCTWIDDREFNGPVMVRPPR